MNCMIRKMKIEIRLATMENLNSLKEMYRQIINHMNKQKISIWDDVYPGEFLEEDIKNNRLYLLIEEENIVSAFALCKTNVAEESKMGRWEGKRNCKVYGCKISTVVCC